MRWLNQSRHTAIGHAYSSMAINGARYMAIIYRRVWPDLAIAQELHIGTLTVHGGNHMTRDDILEVV
jgi:hypothetical protein